jgi:hypothetical protein
MSTEITLSEYRKHAVDLPKIKPFGTCCDETLQDAVYVEPLEGRNTLEVDRTCVLKCGKCGRQYLSRWE